MAFIIREPSAPAGFSGGGAFDLLDAIPTDASIGKAKTVTVSSVDQPAGRTSNPQQPVVGIDPARLPKARAGAPAHVHPHAR